MCAIARTLSHGLAYVKGTRSWHWTLAAVAATSAPMPSVPVEDQSATEAAPNRAPLEERETQPCAACGETLAEVLQGRPGYCFVCAVHVACACSDDP